VIRDYGDGLGWCKAGHMTRKLVCANAQPLFKRWRGFLFTILSFATFTFHIKEHNIAAAYSTRGFIQAIFHYLQEFLSKVETQ